MSVSTILPPLVNTNVPGDGVYAVDETPMKTTKVIRHRCREPVRSAALRAAVGVCVGAGGVMRDVGEGLARSDFPQRFELCRMPL